MPVKSRLLIAGVAVALLGVTTAHGQYSYSYFKEPIPVGIDPARIAVRAPGLTVADVEVELESRGAPGRASSWIGDEWFLLERAAPARNDSELRSLMRGISEDRALEFATPVFLDERGEPLMPTRTLLVQFEEGVAAEDRAALLAEVGELQSVDQEGVHFVRAHTADGIEILDLANALAQHPDVLFAESDMMTTVRRSAIPNDPQFNQLWGLHNVGQSGGQVDFDMDVLEAWDVTRGNPGVLVAVLDDGIQQNHPDINQAPGVDFTGSGTGGDHKNSCDRHGTTVAGCISAIIDNATGVVGVAPESRSISLKVGISNVPCDGTFLMPNSNLLNALSYCQNNGIRVTNSSFSMGPSSAVTSRFNSTRQAGVIHFTSSGNSGTPTVSYPGSLASVNSVGAVRRTGAKSSFSQYGSGLAFVAPGEAIVTTDRTGSLGYSSGSYATTQGTSYASPYAAAVAALLLSKSPELSADEVEQTLRDSARDLGTPGFDNQYGYGLLNANDALGDSKSCGDIIAYGAGCAGPGGFVPDLAIGGCAAAGDSLTIDVTRAPPSGIGLLLLGPPSAPIPLDGGCQLFVNPINTVVSVPLLGTFGLPGSGRISLNPSIPTDAPPGTVNLQLVAATTANAWGYVVSNPVRVTLQ